MGMNESGIVDKVAARLTLDIAPALTQLEKLKTEMNNTLGSGLKASGRANSLGGDTYVQQANGAIMTLRQAIKELDLQFKEGQLAAQDYFDKLTSLQTTYKSALDVTTGIGVVNDQALRSSLLRAQGYVQSYSEGVQQLDEQNFSNRQQLEMEYDTWWQGTLNNQVDQKVKQVKLLHDTQLISARDAYDQLSTIYDEDYQRFASDLDRKMQLLKQMYSYEKEAMAQEASSVVPATTPRVASRSHGFGRMSVGTMGLDMAMFGGMFMAYQDISTGMVQITQQQQGLEQVFGRNIKDQQQLNEVTNQFIDIAKQYGASVTNVLDAAKQWGRQYHDVATAQELVRSSTLLSIVDNMNMTDSAKALEATMNALGMSVSNAAEAQKSSMAIVDQWTNMAHNASVSAQDLAQGVEVSAGAARQAGLSLAQLNAINAAGVRNSGQSGSVIGNMWKTVLAHISSATPKIQAAFKTLGISMTEMGADGQQHMRPVYDLLLELSQASQHLDSQQKAALMTISGGVRQYSRFAQAISNTSTITKDYAIAMNSAGKANGYAQDQLYTLRADLQRLHDTIQQIAYNAGEGALGHMLDGLVKGIADLIGGLQKLPPAADWTIGALGALLLGGRALNGVINTLHSTFTFMRDGIKMWGQVMVDAANSATKFAGATTSVTADLNMKTIATDADIAASEMQVEVAGAVDAALVEEGAAAEEAAAGFSMLDVASGGLALVIGGLITGIGLYAAHLGAAKAATDQMTQSSNNLTASVKQQTQADMQNAQQTDSRISQLEQLKSQYIDARNAVDKAKQGSSQYASAEANLINIEQQLTSIIGKNATDRINASKNISAAFDQEAKAMIESEIKQITAEQSLVEFQKTLTDTVVKNAETRIQAYQAEANAAQAAYDATQHNGMMSGRFGLDSNGRVLGSAYNPAGDIANANVGNILRAHQLADIYAHNQQTQASKGDVYSQELDKLNALLKNPSAAGGGGGLNLGPVVTPGGTKTKKGSKSGASGALAAFVNPFKDLAQQDTVALEPYASAVKKAYKAVSDQNKTLSTALTTMKDNIGSTKDAQAVTRAYTNDINSLKGAQSAMRAEDAKILQMLPTIKDDMNRVNQEYKDGKITAQEHRDAIASLNAEYQRLTNTLIGNQGAIQADAQAMQQATNQITSSIESMLQQAMSAEQQMQDQALTDQYNQQTAAIDTQIQSLTNQKDAIDANISALNQQYQMQSEVNKVTQLQEELQNVMNNKSFRIVNTDGSVSWTYDQAKAASIQQQIADQQATMQHDQQINDMNAQKASIDAQIQALQQKKSDLSQHYQDQKKLLDQYWQYRLNQDTLKQETDRLIAQDGYKKAFLDAQAFVNQMNAEFATIQWPYLMQGQSIAQSLGMNNAGGVPFTISAPNGGIPAPTMTNVSSVMTNTATNAVTSTSKSVTIHIDNVNTSNEGELSQFLDMVGSVAAG